jgi:DNA-binding NarL/FixJ family response regulator
MRHHLAGRVAVVVTGPVRVLLTDDQPIMRSGLRALLRAYADIHVVGEAADGAEAIVLARRLLPDVLVVDAHVPRRDGAAVAKEIAAARLPVRVLLLSAYPLDETAMDALRAGAAGLVAKGAPEEELVGAIRQVAAGQAAVSPGLLRQLLEMIAELPPPIEVERPDLGALTEREREVLVQVARGRSNAEIAAALTVSETTVKTHVGHVLTKLGLRDRVQAVVIAYEAGLVKPGM